MTKIEGFTMFPGVSNKPVKYKPMLFNIVSAHSSCKCEMCGNVIVQDKFIMTNCSKHFLSLSLKILCQVLGQSTSQCDVDIRITCLCQKTYGH